MSKLTPYEQKALKQIEDTRALMSQQIIREENETDEQYEQRKRALTFKQIESMKNLLMQDISKDGTNRSFMSYTKSLIRTYLQNPYSYRDKIREVSRFLWRISPLYRRLIMTSATLPLYNYTLTQKVSFTKKINTNKSMNNYEKVLRILQAINFYDEFAQALAIALRDGVYYAFVYNHEEEGTIFHVLDPQYCKIVGKNEADQWVVYFDATYFKGRNQIFVRGIDGDMTGCWDQVFIDGYENYEKHREYRWFLLPPERTICFLSSESDSFDLILPYYTSLFQDLLNLLDFQQVIVDEVSLKNFYLLVSKIPLLSGTNVVDDFAVSLEICRAMQELIDAAVPETVGTALSPLDLELFSFSHNTAADETNILTESISNVMKNAGMTPNLLSAGETANAVAQKYSVLNDTSLVFIMLSRLESNFNYYIAKNISEDYIYKIHRQTWYNEDEYIERMRQAATLGGPAMDLLTSLGMTPYEAICKLRFEDAIDIKSMMVPLQSSYNTSSTAVGRPRVDDDEAGESTERTRDNT